MNATRFQSLIKECICEVLMEVDHADIVRVCMYCDLISPTPPTPNKSHGMCKEHYIAYAMNNMDMPIEKATHKAEFKEKQGQFSPNTSGASATDPLPTPKSSLG
jgi:hypothetical protein